MVLAYQCPEHGWHRECDVSGEHNDSECTVGQRVCPENVDVPVTGITGSGRSTNENGMMHGNIRWEVGVGYGSRVSFVHAHDADGALDRAVDKLGDEATITEIQPSARNHRRLP